MVSSVLNQHSLTLFHFCCNIQVYGLFSAEPTLDDPIYHHNFRVNGVSVAEPTLVDPIRHCNIQIYGLSSAEPTLVDPSAVIILLSR